MPISSTTLGALIPLSRVGKATYTNSANAQINSHGTRTNYMTRSSHTATYPWTYPYTTNGVTVAIAGTGTTNNIPYVDVSVTGTCSSTGFTIVPSADFCRASAAQGQIWVGSVYAQLVSGTLPASAKISAYIVEENSSKTWISAGSNYITLLDTPQRFVAAKTIVDATAAYARFTVYIGGITAGTVFSGQVIRLYDAQLEKDSLTSIIRTYATDTAVTPSVASPRLDSSMGPRGLLVEQGSTNWFVRSEHSYSFPWPATYTNNGITATLVDSGYLDASTSAATYAEYELTGTTTASLSSAILGGNFCSVTTGVAVGQTWAVSGYYQLVSGYPDWPSGVTIVQRINEYQDATLLQNGDLNSNITPTTSRQRLQGSYSLANTSVNRITHSLLLNNMVADETTFTGQRIRVWAIQVEQRNTPSSYIPSLAGVQTPRYADMIDPISLDSSQLANGLTVYCEFYAKDIGLSTSPRVMQLSVAGTESHRICIYGSTISDKIAVAAFAYGNDQFYYALEDTGITNSLYKVAFSIGPNHGAAAINGINSDMDEVVTYVAPDTLTINRATATNSQFFNALSIKKLFIYPGLLRPEQLAALTQ